MKKILVILGITGICLVNMKCMKDSNDSETNNTLHYSYQLTLSFNYDSWPAATFNWALKDMATMDIEVKDSIVSFASIQNQDGSVSPATQYVQNGIESCTVTWQQGDSPGGMINITSAKGELFLGGDQNIMLYLHITSSNVKTPKFNEVCTRSGSFVTGAESLEPQVYNYIFSLNKKAQNQTYLSLAATLTPI
ncbi:MAG: hypothetical protein ACM3RX_03325 [Methanococcaceae archaeon]